MAQVQGSNVDKLKRIRRRLILIFWVGIPVVLAILYFAFLRNAPPLAPQDALPPPDSPPAKSLSPSP